MSRIIAATPKLGAKNHPETTTWIWNLHADAHDFVRTYMDRTYKGVSKTKWNMGGRVVEILVFSKTDPLIIYYLIDKVILKFSHQKKCPP